MHSNNRVSTCYYTWPSARMHVITITGRNKLNEVHCKKYKEVKTSRGTRPW